MKVAYPSPRFDSSVVDDYHGTKVCDPYRWLEQPDDEETKKFVDDQNAITTPFLESCQSRPKIKGRLLELWNYPKYSCPKRQGDKYFFYKNSGLQNQSVLYVQDSLTSEPRVFFDPNSLSTDGTVSLQITSFSENGETFAYGLSESGSDWVMALFKDVDTGKEYTDILKKLKFTSLSWTHDNKGVFYGCYKDKEGKADGSETDQVENQKLYYHVLGTTQDEDILVAEFPENPKYLLDNEVSDCGKWLIVCPQKECKDNLVYVSKLEGPITGKLELVPIVTEFKSDFHYVTNTESKFIFRTNWRAPNYQLVEIDVYHPEEENWRYLVAEHETNVMDWATAIDGDKLVICYIDDVKHVLNVHDSNTGNFLAKLPLEMGTITGFSGKRKYKDIFYSFASFLTPGIIYHCDMSVPEFQPTVFREIKLNNFDTSNFTTEQVFYNSFDGTRVPMYIIYNKKMERNGNNACVMYGYGGFNVSLLPTFSISRLAFIDNLRAVYAIPNIRGGGEYGEKWHNEGRKDKKQNGFDDFISAAEYLITEHYTCPRLLAISGGSNGGLLVAACTNQRPDLFGACVAHVGVMDLLRFHKFTIGVHWVSDYGSSDIKDQFEYLIKLSPLHNVKIPDDPKVQYPAMLLLTADHDDRVVPLHSLKLIATLQQTLKSHPAQVNPLLIRIEKKAGHGAGKPTAKTIDEYTDIISFLVQTMGIEFHDSLMSVKNGECKK